MYEKEIHLNTAPCCVLCRGTGPSFFKYKNDEKNIRIDRVSFPAPPGQAAQTDEWKIGETKGRPTGPL